MESIELKDLFNAYNQKIEEVVKTNDFILSQIKLQKPKKIMSRVFNYRIVEVFIFSLLAIFLGGYVFSRINNLTLFICGIIGAIFNIIALSGSISQLILINKIDYSKPIIEIKECIERVNTHELYVVKILFLSAPLWWAFNSILLDSLFGIDFLAGIKPNVKIIYLAVNIILFVPLIYFLTKLNPKNAHKKNIKRIIKLFSSSNVLSALKELNEIEKFKK